MFGKRAENGRSVELTIDIVNGILEIGYLVLVFADSRIMVVDPALDAPPEIVRLRSVEHVAALVDLQFAISNLVTAILNRCELA
jgi:hypothetical protein